METCEILDTFPAFVSFWKKSRRLSIEDQIRGWEKEYMASWPELLTKQLNNYAEDKIDWRQIAREKVFPYLNERLPAIYEAHGNILKSSVPLYERANKILDLKSDLTVVIYIGIGSGAGWATTFNNKPAILFGLENIAECDWSSQEALEGLFAHELGHLALYHWRRQTVKYAATDPWWQLYEEGFAQRCESLISGKESFHQTVGITGGDWLDWCQSHKGVLAAEFLKTVTEGKSVAPFFGSWFEIRGKSETGYFLGYEVIKELEKKYSLKEIALLEDYESNLKPVLQRMI
jgi:hypothetical protein